MTVSDPDTRMPEASALIAAVFDLPPACARLTAALIRGEDLRTYVKAAGISLNTAKFHLKAAFAATGTRRQAELVRVAGALVRDLGHR